jgi:hypothetical protein
VYSLGFRFFEYKFFIFDIIFGFSKRFDVRATGYNIDYSLYHTLNLLLASKALIETPSNPKMSKIFFLFLRYLFYESFFITIFKTIGYP